jgi:cation transport ATPase
MIANDVEKPGSSARVGVSCLEGIIRLRDEGLLGIGLGDRCVFFLRHVFTLSEVTWVEINRNLATANIRYDVSHFRLSEFLQRLAAALRGSFQTLTDAPSASFSRDLEHSTGWLKIRRVDATLTTWDIVHDRPGRIRLRHQALHRNLALAGRLQGAIENAAGVIECKTWPVTGSVLIRFNPDLTSVPSLLRILDQARFAPASPDCMPSSAKSAGFGLANTSLALAVAGEMAAPFLLPASAVLLVGTNLHTLRAAGRQLIRGELGLPVLYTSIVAATLATGQFIASASMSWMLTFWNRRYRNDLASARRRLLGQISHQPLYVRLATPRGDSIDVEIPIEDLKINDVIVVSAGEQIPADGRILQGRGLADERMIRGLEGLSRKQPDDEVFAGSTIRIGELYIEVLRHGSETQVATLARVALEATTAPHGSRTPTLRGETFAEQTVAPTLAIAGLGLLIGDVSTAGAILRPDYATGPGVAFPLETLQAIALCLRHGILIREADAIERLATADLLVFEHHRALEHTELDLDTVEVFPGHIEADLLRYAATAFHDLDDERAVALRSACRSRSIALLDLQPTEFATDFTLLQGNNRIKVGELGTRARNHSSSRSPGQVSPRQTNPDAPDSLMVGINGQVAGLIHFRRSDRLEATSALRRLRSKHNLQIGIISDQPDSKLASLMTSLGADFQIGGLSPDDRIRFLRNCRNRGFKVALVGEWRTDPRAIAEVHIAISLVGSETSNLDHNPAPICVLQPRITKLAELWDITSIHRRRLRVAHGYALIPNLACIAGAFVWGFTSLASVVVTNLGTYCVYSRTTASIRSLEHQIAKSLKTRQSSAHKTMSQAKSQKDNGV